jgi:hypothetical protein
MLLRQAGGSQRDSRSRQGDEEAVRHQVRRQSRAGGGRPRLDGMGTAARSPGGGLPSGGAQADATWSTDPHLCAALQWESYAATLPPALPTVPGNPWLRGGYW